MKIVNLSRFLVIGTAAVTIGVLSKTPEGITQALPFVRVENNLHKTDKVMMSKCQVIREKSDQLNSEIKSMDDKLDELVVKMNSATSIEKLDAAVAVINETTRQRRVLQTKNTTFNSAVRIHIMEHMAGSKQLMKMCPLLQGI